MSLIKINQDKINQIEAEKAKIKLQEIDINSIRYIREFISSLHNAPKDIKDIEELAKTYRSKL
jgi:hypothetical protein